jgi:hypothetical protein
MGAINDGEVTAPGIRNVNLVGDRVHCKGTRMYRLGIRKRGGGVCRAIYHSHVSSIAALCAALTCVISQNAISKVLPAALA